MYRKLPRATAALSVLLTPAIFAQAPATNKPDREITAEIRRAVYKDKSLSMAAHNCQIMTKNGMVTLVGRVKSDAEKSAVEQAAIKVAGDGKVTDQLTVSAK